jgi:hypothetical protein
MNLKHQIYGDFEFSSVLSPDFKEDAVREEIIAPLLRSLGYRPEGDYKIHRSKALLHPYVMFGSQKRKVNIIPDYLISTEKVYRFVLDAKAPSENVTSGDNVAQVYSYAIHPDVRAWNYGLCNGRTLALFEIMSIKPKHEYDLLSLDDAMILDINQKLNPRTIAQNEILDYRLDGGTYLHAVMGIQPGTTMHFPAVPIVNLGKVEENHYSMSVVTTDLASRELCFTFDFDAVMLVKLLTMMSPENAGQVRDSLVRQPFRYVESRGPSLVNIAFRFSQHMQFSTAGEMFLPLEVVDFIGVA